MSRGLVTSIETLDFSLSRLSESAAYPSIIIADAFAIQATRIPSIYVSRPGTYPTQPISPESVIYPSLWWCNRSQTSTLEKSPFL